MRTAPRSIIKRITGAFIYTRVFVLSRFDPSRQTYYFSKKTTFSEGSVASEGETRGSCLSAHRGQEGNSGRSVRIPYGRLS